MTWEEAFAYARTVIDQECADQGVTVEITDPELIAYSVRLLRAGKRNDDARRIEPGVTAARSD